jgi:predicted AlkP superfamily pyrophosphatase or phosphodiesterase
MADQEVSKLFICYIPGMDLRRIHTDDTPYLAESLRSYPWVRIKSFPNTDMVPTLLTGVYPHEHGVWQVRLKSWPARPGRRKSLAKWPDTVTTTLQCIRHFVNHSFDLATIADRRLQAFEIKRFKHTRQYFPSVYDLWSRFVNGDGRLKKAKGDSLTEEIMTINGLRSIFGIVGKEASRYVFNRRFEELDSLLDHLGSGKYTLECLELHSLDIIEHWNLDDQPNMRRYYRRVDDFLRDLHRICRAKGIRLVVLSDHGQEEVRGTIDIMRELRQLNLPEDEYEFYVEAPMARFWFHTDRAREEIQEMLFTLKNGVVLSYRDMHQFNVRFEDGAYGEVYFIADPGYIMFPHDFYQPLANLFLGLTDWHQQRRRIINPKLRGSHGYLPHHDSEKGFMVVLDQNYTVGLSGEEVDIIDVAPSMLNLLGYQRPDYMKGSCRFIGAHLRATTKPTDGRGG